MLAVFIAGMAWVQFSTPDLPDNDGYYHIKLARVMRSEGLTPDFPWLPLTILNEREFYDHHFLFHVALMPFTYGDLRLGAKWASVIFAGLAFLSVWGLLRSQAVPWAALWALGLLAVSDAFLYRMSIARAQSLSLALMMIGLYLLFKHKYAYLLPLGFLFVWFYDGFPLLVFVCAAYTAGVWLAERRIVLQPLLFAGIGIGLGLVINPYFPDNLVFITRHIAPKLFDPTEIRVGSEWYPYTTGQLLENSPLALAAFLSGGLALGLQPKRMDARTATALLLAILFGLMLFQSRRFIEYFPPFALLFAALAWAPVIRPDAPLAGAPASPGSRLTPWLAGLALGSLVLAGGWLTLGQAQESLQSAKPYGLFEGASQWLIQNSDPGELVFQTDWDDFPRLFYYNSHNTYTLGLDPTYMQIDNPELYEVWVALSQGKIDQPSQVIASRFGARLVVTDLNHAAFERRAQADPAMEEVYRDELSAVYRIVGAP
jgi:hypothetical protein